MAVANIKKAYKGTQLMEMVREARERTFGLVADLTDEQLMGPRLAIVNPLRWEIGHVAWFQERWTLRDRGQLPSMLSNADALYDSAAIPHDVRWDLPLPSREETLAYLRSARDRLLERLSEGDPTEELTYFVLLAVFHEDMHDEAFTYTRQTLEYPPARCHALGRILRFRQREVGASGGAGAVRNREGARHAGGICGLC